MDEHKAESMKPRDDLDRLVERAEAQIRLAKQTGADGLARNPSNIYVIAAEMVATITRLREALKKYESKFCPLCGQLAVRAVGTLCAELGCPLFAKGFAMQRAYDELRVATPPDVILDLVARMRAAEEDAKRWQALMRCGRIKMQGSSGVDPHTGERNGNNIHFGAEFWPERHDKFPDLIEGHDISTRWGVACLRALADAILEHEAARQHLESNGNG